jgi:hypothetical protein
MTTNLTLNDFSVVSATENVSRILNDFIFYSIEDLLRHVPEKMIKACEVNVKTGALQVKVATATEEKDDFKEIVRFGKVQTISDVNGNNVEVRSYGIIARGILSYEFGKELFSRNKNEEVIKNIPEGKRIPFEFSYLNDMGELHNFLQSIDSHAEVTENMTGGGFIKALASAKKIDEVLSLLELVDNLPSIDNLCSAIAEILFEKPFAAKILPFDEDKPFKLDGDGAAVNDKTGVPKNAQASLGYNGFIDDESDDGECDDDDIGTDKP